MRLRNLFMPMFVGLAFVGCSNEEDVNPGNDTNGEPKYLNVSINTTGAVTRATELEGEYEKGTGNENKVTSVRFYFFDGEGNAASVKSTNGNTKVNYLDATPNDTNKDEMDNVEKILEAVLVIETPKGDELPSSIVAVLNPTSEIKNTPITNLTTLNNIIENFSGTATAEAGFLMSNSVYAKDNIKMEAVNVSGHLYPTADAAKADPVIIHVERVLAKVRLTVGLGATTLSDGTNIYKTSKADATDAETEKFGNKEVYVKFLGWNVTATAEKSRLMKEINSAWDDNLFSATLRWNTADFYRSFWAVNPESMNYMYGKFTDHAQNIKNFDAGTETSPKINYTYLQENASDDYTDGTDPNTPSQVIIAAQLVDETGASLEFAEYAGIRYSINDLKKKYAEFADLWKDITKEDGTKGRVQMGADDIELFTDADDHDNTTQKETENRYKVYAKVADENTIWYASDSKDDTTPVNANQTLKNLGSAKVWTDGYTYYYFDIRHLNGSDSAEGAKGKYGVVRNHVYAANIQSLVGLGTPVFDPEEVIYPETPGEDETFIAAKIKILSWRIVNQNIDLEW